MQPTKDQVRHIAKLARINLAEEQVGVFTEQLGAILGYVEKINELDTSAVPETNQVTGLTSVTRPDTVQSFGAMPELLAQSRYPIEESQIKVPKSI